MPRRIHLDDSRALLEELLRVVGGRLDHGSRAAGEIIVGDMVASIDVRITRREPAVHLEAHRQAAIAELERHPQRATRCECDTVKNLPWSAKVKKSCGQPVTAAVVREAYRWSYIDPSVNERSFLFVCSSHRIHHRIETKYVLAVVNLPAAALKVAKRAAEEVRASIPWE